MKRRSGYLDIVLSFYENEIIEPESADASGAGFSSTITDEEPFAEIILLSDVAFFEWRLLDGRTLEYQYDWDLPGRLPLQLELICAFGSSGGEIRQVFWIPPRQNPEVFMRQLSQNVGAGIGDGADGEGETPEIDPELQVPIPPQGGGGGQGRPGNPNPPTE